MTISWTVELAHSRRPPMGAKMTPTAKNSGRTVLGVRMGCHAFSRCCRNALSVRCHQLLTVLHTAYWPVSLVCASYWVASCSSAAPSSAPPRSRARCYYPSATPWFATYCYRCQKYIGSVRSQETVILPHYEVLHSAIGAALDRR